MSLSDQQESQFETCPAGKAVSHHEPWTLPLAAIMKVARHTPNYHQVCAHILHPQTADKDQDIGTWM
jgi:hypothetical protein